MKTKKIAGLILASAIALGVCSCDGYFTIKPDGLFRKTLDLFFDDSNLLFQC